MPLGAKVNPEGPFRPVATGLTLIAARCGTSADAVAVVPPIAAAAIIAITHAVLRRI